MERREDRAVREAVSYTHLDVYKRQPNPIVSNESGLIMWLVAGVFGILFMFCGYLLIYKDVYKRQLWRRF